MSISQGCSGSPQLLQLGYHNLPSLTFSWPWLAATGLRSRARVWIRANCLMILYFMLVLVLPSTAIMLHTSLCPS